MRAWRNLHAQPALPLYLTPTSDSITDGAGCSLSCGPNWRHDKPAAPGHAAFNYSFIDTFPTDYHMQKCPLFASSPMTFFPGAEHQHGAYHNMHRLRMVQSLRVGTQSMHIGNSWQLPAPWARHHNGHDHVKPCCPQHWECSVQGVGQASHAAHILHCFPPQLWMPSAKHRKEPFCPKPGPKVQPFGVQGESLHCMCTARTHTHTRTLRAILLD